MEASSERGASGGAREVGGVGWGSRIIEKRASASQRRMHEGVHDGRKARGRVRRNRWW